MLELFGRGYVVEHCVSASNAVQRENDYRVFVTEALRGIGRSCGVDIKPSYIDILNSYTKDRAERSAEDIISNIKHKADNIRG